MIKISEENQEIDKEKTSLCAVLNPKAEFKSWFYNVFLGRQNVDKNKPLRNEIKVNWLFPALTDKDIELLRSKTCKVIILFEDVEIDIIDDEEETYKKAFATLLNLFDNIAKIDVVKQEIKKLITKEQKEIIKKGRKLIKNRVD